MIFTGIKVGTLPGPLPSTIAAIAPIAERLDISHTGMTTPFVPLHCAD